jgi:Na+/H+ antiporter NhaD/arsenite permease-like protein
VALLAPLAMATAGEMGISAFLITVMIANGANAGAFSPFAPTGIIANGLITQLGIEMNPWTQVYLPSLVAQTFVALISYLLFGGIRLARQDRHERAQGMEMDTYAIEPWTPGQMITLVAIAALIIGVIFFQADPAFLAVALATLLTMVRAADQKAAFDHIPWDTIMMVCGVSVLIAILQTTGGIDLVTRLLAEISTAQTVTGVLAFFAGIVSAYSSSSGVVMPAFIAMVPGLLARLAGANPVALVSSINVGAHLVDVSPLSTLGALCITNAPLREDKERLFRNLLIYGLSMAVVGAGVCYVFFGLLLA